MVIEIAKVFIPLSIQYEINIFPVSEIHNPPPFCTTWQCQQLQKIYQTANQPTNHCFIRNCTESNVKNITLFFLG